MTHFNVYTEPTTTSAESDMLDIEIQLTRGRSFVSLELTTEEANQVVAELAKAIPDEDSAVAALDAENVTGGRDG